MCGSGGGETQTVVNKADSSPWSGVQPHLTNVLEGAEDLYNNSNRSYFPGQTVVPFSGQTEQGLQNIEQRATAGSPIQAAGNQVMQDTIQGNYLNSNPAYQGMIDRVSGDVRNQVDSQFASANRYGSGMHSETMARGIGDAIAPIAFQNYSDERGRQSEAAAMAPQYAQADYLDSQALLGVGGQREAMGNAQLQEQIARHNYEQNLPYDELGRYAAIAQGGQYGGSTTSSSTQPVQGSNPFLQGLGVLSTGAGLANSLWGGANPLFSKPWG